MVKLFKNMKLVFILYIFVLAVTGCSYNNNNNNNKVLNVGLANLEQAINSKETSGSMVSFNAKQGEKLKFDYNSFVDSGSLKLLVKDPAGNIIGNFPTGKKGSEVIVAGADGKYEVYAGYEEFTGGFKVHVDK